MYFNAYFLNFIKSTYLRLGSYKHNITFNNNLDKIRTNQICVKQDQFYLAITLTLESIDIKLEVNITIIRV